MKWNPLKWSTGSNEAASSRGGTYLHRRNDEAQKQLEDAAKRDGTAHMPGPQARDLSPYELQVCQEAKQWMNNTAGDLRRRDALLYPRFAKARKDFRDAFKQYETKKSELGGRPVNIQMSSVVYWPLMLLMALAEAGVNVVAFLALFPDSLLVAVAAATVLAIVLVFSAHSIGAAVQQRKGLGWAVILGLLSIAMTLGLAYLRYTYINFESEGDAAILTGRPKMNADMVTGFFVIFNLLFLALASWLAAKLHDEDATYEQRYKTYLKMREILVGEKQRRDSNYWESMRNARDEEGLHRRLVAQYRVLNMEHREIKATPQVWHDRPPETMIEIDSSLFELVDNDCRFEAEFEEVKA